MSNDDKNVDVEVVEDSEQIPEPAIEIDFSEEEMNLVEKSLEKLREESEGVTKTENVGKEEGISEQEVEDAESKPEEVKEEIVEEVDGEEPFFTAEELESLPWEELSKNEHRIPKEAMGIYKSIKNVFYRKSEKDAHSRAERDAEFERKMQEQHAELQRLVLEREKHEEQRREQSREDERIKYLEGLDPEERAQHEYKQEIGSTKAEIAKLKQEIVDIKIKSFQTLLESKIDNAIKNSGVTNESVAESLHNDSMPELLREYDINSRAGRRVDLNTLPEAIVRKVYGRYKTIAKTLLEADPSFKDLKNKFGKEAISRVIKKKKDGATVIKSSPTGVTPKKEPSLPDRITDIGEIIDKDPEVLAAIKQIEEENRRVRG